MDISHTFPVNYGTKFPIMGLYPNYKNTIEINNSTFEILTKPIPHPKTIIIKNILTKTISPFEQDLYFVDLKTKLYAFDKKGEIRYYKPVGKRGVYNVFHTNNKIHYIDSIGIHTLSESTPILAFANEAHHDTINLGNKYLRLHYSHEGLEDTIEIVNQYGTFLEKKYIGDLFWGLVTSSSEMEILKKIIFDKSNPRFNSNGDIIPTDWAHPNSIVYNNTTDILYISVRHQGVIAVKFAEWELLWWMADNSLKTLHPGVPYPNFNFTDIPSLDPYRVKGDGSTDGPKNQHALFLHKNGNIGMFDNQGDEDTNPQGSRYVEYQISGTHGNYTAKKIHEYRDPSVYSRIRSDVDFLPNNNLLIAYGVPGIIREVNLDNIVEFEMSIDSEVNKDSKLYRVNKMPIYPYMDKNKKYSIDH